MEPLKTSRVAVFRNDLLPLSETFIRAQLGLRSWQVVLLGQRRVEGGLNLDGIALQITPPPINRIKKLWERLAFWLNRPIPRFVRILKSLDVDLVHAHFGTDATDIWPSVKASGLSMLVTLHGFDINIDRKWWEAGHGGLRRRVYPRRLQAMAAEPSVRFIAVSEAIRHRAIECGVPAKKIDVAYNGIDTQKFQPDEPIKRRQNRIIFVGRMVENKAPIQLIRAFSAIASKVKDPQLVMIGDGPLMEAAKTAAIGCKGAIEFLGALPSNKVIENLRQAKVLCLPSQKANNGASEGFGQVLLEAQSCGVPVLGAATGGIPEAMRDGVTGHVFPAGDQLALETCLLKMLLSPNEHLEKMSAAGREFVVEHFDLESTNRSLEDIYEKSMKKFAPPWTKNASSSKNGFSSHDYWSRRYRKGGDSGPGSFGHLARFKADVINKFVAEKSIQSVIEFGCGDGNQLGLLECNNYVGYDISPTALAKCRARFKDDNSKKFFLSKHYDGRKAELGMSLDVIFHLTEEEVFDTYMRRLFDASLRHVLIYSSNHDAKVELGSVHVRHRCFTEWVDKEIPANWRLVEKVSNVYPYNGDYNATSFADFYVYRKLI